MAYEVFFHPTTQTGGPKAFNASLVRTLDGLGARHAPAEETARLIDGTLIQLFVHADDDIALLTTEVLTPAVVQAVWMIGVETASMVRLGEIFYSLPGGGEVSTSFKLGFPGAYGIDEESDFKDLLEADFEHWQADEVEAAERQAEYDKALAERRAQQSAGRPRVDLSGKPAPSLFKRLSDALFGKAI